MKKAFYILSFALIIISCSLDKKSFVGKLKFSSDTIFFDTIFTQVGSATKAFIVYNPNNYPVKIDKIYLCGNQLSKFRLNIDGVPSNYLTNKIIDSHDSIFIFVDVTINPGVDSLLVIDSIMFISGENIQKIVLTAVGKDVHLLKSAKIQSQSWVADKAYLIYDYVLVDSLQTLTIEPGVEIYFHYNAALLVKGTLIINGNKEKPVILKGDRIDMPEFFLDRPGQWFGIVLMKGSKNNFINYAKISESVFGIIIDSVGSVNSPGLWLMNSMISGISNTGVYSVNSHIYIINSVISNCNFNNIAVLMSGSLGLFHSTITNNIITRKSVCLGVQNYYTNNGTVYQGGNIDVFMFNTIIHGTNENEFAANAYSAGTINLYIKNSILKISPKLFDFNAPYFINCLFNVNPLFVDEFKKNYQLKPNSPAINKGDRTIVEINAPILQYDINGTDRLADDAPDIGAYEYK